MRFLLLISFMFSCTGNNVSQSTIDLSISTDIAKPNGKLAEPDYDGIRVANGYMLRYNTVSGDAYAVIVGQPVGLVQVYAAFIKEKQAGRVTMIEPNVDIFIPANRLPMTGLYEIIISNFDSDSGVYSFESIGGP